MKKRTILFLQASFVLLMLFPLANLLHMGMSHGKMPAKWWRASVLYSLDFVLPYIGKPLYDLGISTAPSQVMIGKGGWLYLGDDHEASITANRRGPTATDEETATRIGEATASWAKWSKARGVAHYQIILAANKETVYPEGLPGWARPAARSMADGLLAKVDAGIYVDTRPALLAAKSRYPHALYYQTDTHWNSLGAWAAFQAFSQALAKKEPTLKWLSDSQVSVAQVKDREGGDLARFLRLAAVLHDQEVAVQTAPAPVVASVPYQVEWGDLKPARRPLLFRSAGALNQKKVLWLRDSFGEGMAPFMAATFSETLQMHYDDATPARLARLIETYKPAYLVITVVERRARDAWFKGLPPETRGATGG